MFEADSLVVTQDADRPQAYFAGMTGGKHVSEYNITRIPVAIHPRVATATKQLALL